MSFHYMERELLEQYDKYSRCYGALLEEREQVICSTEYGYGGEALHRGCYCPSPVIDIVIGGGNRGRLSKRRNEGKGSDYIYYKDKDGRLVMVDTYADFGGPEKVLYDREFIIYEQGRTVAPQFEFMKGSKQKGMVSLSLCDYTEGRIHQYRRLYMPSHTEDGSLVKHMEQRMLFAEDYIYGSSGLLERAVIGNMLPGISPWISSEFTCKFYHDEAGFLRAYQVMYDGKMGFEPIVYKIPKYKMRRI